MYRIYFFQLLSILMFHSSCFFAMEEIMSRSFSGTYSVSSGLRYNYKKMNFLGSNFILPHKQDSPFAVGKQFFERAKNRYYESEILERACSELKKKYPAPPSEFFPIATKKIVAPQPSIPMLPSDMIKEIIYIALTEKIKNKLGSPEQIQEFASSWPKSLKQCSWLLVNKQWKDIVTSDSVIKQVIKRAQENEIFKDISIYSSEERGSYKKKDYTDLYVAVLKKDENIIRVLVDIGADVNEKSLGKDTPLHCAVWDDNFSIVKFLISRGADVHLKNIWGWTPLHYSAWSGNYLMSQVLLKGGADPNVPDDNGETPLTIAKERGQQQVVDLLKKYEAQDN